MDNPFKDAAEAVEFFKSNMHMTDAEAIEKANTLFEKEEDDDKDKGDDKEKSTFAKAIEKIEGIAASLKDKLSNTDERIDKLEKAVIPDPEDIETDPGGGPIDVDVSVPFMAMAKSLEAQQEALADTIKEQAKTSELFGEALETQGGFMKSLTEQLGTMKEDLKKATTFIEAVKRARNEPGYSFGLAGVKVVEDGGDEITLPGSFGELQGTLEKAVKDGKITNDDQLDCERAYREHELAFFKSIYKKAVA